MARDDQRSWSLQQAALEITCVSVGAFGEITHVGGPAEDGSMWHLSPQALIEAIQEGTRYYLSIEGNSYLVTVGRDDNGKPALNVGAKDVGLLYMLPRFVVG